MLGVAAALKLEELARPRLVRDGSAMLGVAAALKPNALFAAAFPDSVGSAMLGVAAALKRRPVALR